MDHLRQGKEAPKQEAPQTQSGGKWAGRASRIEADPKRVRRYDLYLRSDWSSDVWCLVIGLAMGALCVWLFGLGEWWQMTLGVIAGLVSLLMFWIGAAELWHLFGGERYRMYGESLLVGGVVVNENPLQVAALTNVGEPGRRFYRYFSGGDRMSKKEYDRIMATAQEKWTEVWQEYITTWPDSLTEEAEKIREGYWAQVHGRFRRVEGKWACMLHTVGSGDWSYKKGDRLPCASAYDDMDEKRQMWTEVKLMPLVWGTGDRKELDRCLEEVSPFEWELLEEVAPLVAEREPGKLYLLHWMPEGSPYKYGFEPAGSVK